MATCSVQFTDDSAFRSRADDLDAGVDGDRRAVSRPVNGDTGPPFQSSSSSLPSTTGQSWKWRTRDAVNGRSISYVDVYPSTKMQRRKVDCHQQQRCKIAPITGMLARWVVLVEVPISRGTALSRLATQRWRTTAGGWSRSSGVRSVTSLPVPPPPADLPSTICARTVRVSIIHNNGTQLVEEISIPQLRDTTGLLVSELLVVESASVSVTPRIIPRTRCIIVTMAHIRGLIFRDRVRAAS